MTTLNYLQIIGIILWCVIGLIFTILWWRIDSNLSFPEDFAILMAGSICGAVMILLWIVLKIIRYFEDKKNLLI